MRFNKIVFLTVLLSPLAVAVPTTDSEKASYGLGLKTGENLNKQQISIDPPSFYQGLIDAITKQQPALSEQEVQTALKNLQKQQQAKVADQNKQRAAENLAKGTAFLNANKTKPGVKTLADGLQYIELVAGKGESPKPGDYVTVNYRGMLIDGTEFDNSSGHNDSVSTFQLENLIPAWQQVLPLMKPGSKWKIFAPAKLAYGDKSVGNLIGPNSALIFEIELVNFRSKITK